MAVRLVTGALIAGAVVALAFVLATALGYVLIAAIVLGVPLIFLARGRTPSSRPGPGASGPGDPGYGGRVSVGEEDANPREPGA